MDEEIISEGSEGLSEGISEGSDSVVDTITSSQADEIISLLQNIDLNNAQTFMLVQDNLPTFYDTARLLLTYGFVYVPLMMVVIILWWFFKQFLHKY